MANLSIRDVNPLEHITSDIAISQYNYESILNGLVEWESSKMDTVTIRLATNTDPYFVDYTIKTKYSYDTRSGSTVSSPVLDAGAFAYGEKLAFVAMYDSTGANTDRVNLRVNNVSDGGVKTDLYAEATLYSEVTEQAGVYTETETYNHNYDSGLYFRRSVSASKVEDYRTLAPVSKGDTISEGDNCFRLVVPYDEMNVEHVSNYGQLVVYYDTVYRLEGTYNPRYTPDSKSSGFRVACDSYEAAALYKYGAYVYYDGEFFVHSSDSSTVGVAPKVYDSATGTITYNSSTWTSTLLIDVGIDAVSGVSRWNAVTDISGFVLHNSSDTDADATIDVKLTASLNIKGEESKQKPGVNILNTSNYSRYPTGSTKWSEGKIYGPTDESVGIYGLQNYTATMIFNHANDDTSKLNIINYDGPDLDQGLAVFLPVSVTLSDGSVGEPEDGYMFEFVFRIWPNPALNGNTVNDLIINKAQVYVYNISDYTDFDWGSTTFDPTNVYPIARFSMARLTNFYVFGENVGVPDKPVVYKARFVYSKADHSWKTFDYYQFPDHVFMSPGGFVDPMTANDEGHPGVETGGFPLFQDPFSNTELRPIRVTDDYTSRIQP